MWKRFKVTLAELFSRDQAKGDLLFVQAFSFPPSFMLGNCSLRRRGRRRRSWKAAAAAGRAALPEDRAAGEERGVYLVHSIRGDGGQSDSICPLKAFSVGATYFPFTVSSSSLRLGCGEEARTSHSP